MTNFNNHKNTPLSSMNTREEILQVTREKEEELMTDAKNVTSENFSLTFSPQIDNSNVIFAS